jgi:hypothetical protein
MKPTCIHDTFVLAVIATDDNYLGEYKDKLDVQSGKPANK